MRLRGFGVEWQGFGVFGFYRFGANRTGALRRYPVVSYPPPVQVQRRGQELACDGPLENQARERSYLTRTTAIPMKHGGWYESCMTLSKFNRGIRLRV